MPLQLDVATLALMFITLAMTSFIVMFLIWRINRDLPGVLMWMVATLLNTASALTTLLITLYSWSAGWGLILSTAISLSANMLVLEGSLRFRGFHSRYRWQLFLMLIPVFLTISWLLSAEPSVRASFHDLLTASFQMLAGVTLLWRTRSRDEFQANLLAALAGILIAVTIIWQLTLAPVNGQGAGAGAQWYLFAGANLHVAWIFGLSVACYFRSRQQVMMLAREDALTMLPNRRWIDEKLSETLLESRRSGEKFALIMLDINDFKLVNDKYGHSAGDIVLAEMARRLQLAVRDSDFAGRLGGDEFLILARQIESESMLTHMVQRLRQQLNGVMTVEGHDIDIHVSIGTSVFPTDGDIADVLLGGADVGMYRDKKVQKQVMATARSATNGL